MTSAPETPTEGHIIQSSAVAHPTARRGKYLVVVDDVPVPKEEWLRGRKRVFPLDTMVVGQSFAVPSSRVKSLRASIHRQGRLDKAAGITRKFTVLMMPEEGKPARSASEARCWRVA